MFRTRIIQTTSLLAGLLLAASSFAQVPSDAPAGTTGLCKDGSYTSSATKKGSCRGHHGVQTWYAGAGTAPAAAPAPTSMNAPATAPSASAPPPTMTPPATAPAAASPSPTTTMTAPATAPKTKWTPPATAAAGGGPGLVWVNTSTKVYHCPADPWYGKTKAGSYMSEADAKAQGAHADHGKPCS
jgi:hypothetical protein